jgi:DNA-binding FrmR family transcriptional regulator
MGIYMKRDEKSKSLLTNRVNRVAGQVQGIGRMIEEDRECPEVLNTISAVHSALRALEAKLLEDHVRHCVCDAAKDSEKLEERLEELIKLYRRRLS